jgi:hypothetical protein
MSSENNNTIEHLPSKHKVLSSNPSIAPHKNEKKREQKNSLIE